MAISNDQKVDYLWKKVGYGRAKTDTNANKSAVNEATSSALFVQGTSVWAESSLIPTSIPASTSGVVNVRPTSAPVECTNDGTASTNRTWKTGLTDWIPPEVGSTYLIKVYIHTSGNAGTAAGSGTQVYPAGSGNNDEWFFDYPSGTLNFIGTNLPDGVSFSGKSVYVSGAYYTGIKGVAGPGTAATFTSLAVSGITTTETLKVGTAVTISAGVITATSFVGDGSGLTGISAGIGTQGSVNTSGIITASSFVGDGSGLTGISGVGTQASVNTSGIITASTFSGFSNLQATYSSDTKVFNVTVASKTANHRYSGGSGSAYYIDGVESPFLTLTPGMTYRFLLSSSDMSSHPFRFYLEADKTTAYTTNVSSTATYTEIVVTDTTPIVLFYQCSAHPLMGNAVNNNTNTIFTTGIVTATSSVVGTAVTSDVTGINVTGGVKVSGVTTASSFIGDGSALSGIITQLGTLATLAGLLTTSFNNGDVLMYSTADGRFIATTQQTLTGAGKTTLVSLDDVSGSPATNNVLIFNGSEFEFTTPFEIVDLSDTVDDNIVDHGTF